MNMLGSLYSEDRWAISFPFDSEIIGSGHIQATYGMVKCLQVDHQSWIENRVSSDVTDFHRTGLSFFGGAPDDQIPSEVQSRRGFSGCLKKVIAVIQSFHLLSSNQSVFGRALR